MNGFSDPVSELCGLFDPRAGLCPQHVQFDLPAIDVRKEVLAQRRGERERDKGEAYELSDRGSGASHPTSFRPPEEGRADRHLPSRSWDLEHIASGPISLLRVGWMRRDLCPAEINLGGVAFGRRRDCAVGVVKIAPSNQIAGHLKIPFMPGGRPLNRV